MDMAKVFDLVKHGVIFRKLIEEGLLRVKYALQEANQVFIMYWCQARCSTFSNYLLPLCQWFILTA